MADFWSQFPSLLTVITAGLLGGIIGLERELSRRSAGLRTHILVCAASACLVVLGGVLSTSFYAQYPESVLRIDPLNIIQAIIVGVSFIGGGTIIKDERKNIVDNLTTATSILFTAGVGIAVALGQIYFATGLTIFAVAVNYGLLEFEKRVLKTQGP